jgi:hypothetical protein
MAHPTNEVTTSSVSIINIFFTPWAHSFLPGEATAVPFLVL